MRQKYDNIYNNKWQKEIKIREYQNKKTNQNHKYQQIQEKKGNRFSHVKLAKLKKIITLILV